MSPGYTFPQYDEKTGPIFPSYLDVLIEAVRKRYVFDGRPCSFSKMPGLLAEAYKLAVEKFDKNPEPEIIERKKLLSCCFYYRAMNRQISENSPSIKKHGRALGLALSIALGFRVHNYYFVKEKVSLNIKAKSNEIAKTHLEVLMEVENPTLDMVIELINAETRINKAIGLPLSFEQCRQIIAEKQSNTATL